MSAGCLVPGDSNSLVLSALSRAAGLAVVSPGEQSGMDYYGLRSNLVRSDSDQAILNGKGQVVAMEMRNTHSVWGRSYEVRPPAVHERQGECEHEREQAYERIEQE